MARKTNTISIRLSLDQADKLKSELKALGAEGEKALDKIRSAAVKADFAKFSASAKQFGNDLATVGRRAAIAFGALATAATGAAAGIYAVAKNSAEVIDAQGKAAQAVGLTIDQYGRLQFAAEQGGASQDQFSTGIRTFQRAAVQASEGLKQYTRAFDRIGVSVTDARGKLRPMQDILNDVADRFAAMPDNAVKTATAMDLFGRAGALLIPTLNGGSRSLKQLGDQAEALGIVFTKDQFMIAQALNDTVNELKRAAGGLKNQIGVLFAPELTKGAAALRDAIVRNKDAIIAFATAVRDRAVAVVEDLFNALTGNDAAVVNRNFLTWRDGILQFGDDIVYVVGNVVVPLFKAIVVSAGEVAKAINAVFGTNLTGGQLLITAAALQLLGIFNLLASAGGLVVAAIRLIGSALAAAFGGSILASASGFFYGLLSSVEAAAVAIASFVGLPALIAAAFVAAGVAIYAYWDEIKAAAKVAYDYVAGIFSAENLAAIWDGLAGAATAAWDETKKAVSAAGTFITGTILPAIGAAAAAAWNGIADTARALASDLEPIWRAIADAGQSAWSGVADAANAAWQGISDGATSIVNTISGIFSTAAGAIGKVFSGIADTVSGIWENATSGIADAAQAVVDAISKATDLSGNVEGAAKLAAALVQPFRDAVTAINKIFSEIRTLAAGALNSIRSTVSSIAASIRSEIAGILSSLRQAAAEAARLRSAASSGSAQAYASGGYLQGAGTSTSDSILIRVSTGEYIINAKAVRKLGVGFLDMINKGILPAVRGFRDGGIVAPLMAAIPRLHVDVPAFASGGLAPARSETKFTTPLYFSMPDGSTLETRAADDAAEKLGRFYSRQSVLSAGKPSGAKR